MVSRAAGLPPPIDGVTTDTDDDNAVHAAAQRARALGFGAKLCIHPRQLDAVRTAFAPRDDEIVWATGVLEALARRQAAGEPTAAFEWQGRMVDKPVLSLARRLLSHVPGNVDPMH